MVVIGRNTKRGTELTHNRRSSETAPKTVSEVALFAFSKHLEEQKLFTAFTSSSERDMMTHDLNY